MMDPNQLRQLSKAELEASLGRLQQHDRSRIDALEETVQELHVHRIELEMQNRALSELQQELQTSVARYASLYDRLPIGYMTVTPEGRILESNMRATAWLQGDRRALVGRYLRAFVRAEEDIRISDYLDRCARSDTEEIVETALVFHDGSARPIQLSGQRAVTPDGATQIHLAMTDIAMLKQTQRNLERVNAEMEAFTHAMSHDLRAPLLSITTYGQVLLEEHADQLNDEGRNMVERMRRAAQRMEEALRQLLEYCRLTRQPLTPETVCLDDVVRDLLIEHRALIQYRKAQIDVQRPLAAVIGSKAIVDQVLRNLLSNALKYTLPDTAPRVRISTHVHGARVVLQIADEGIGIDARFQDRLFRLFERLHSHSQYPGAGVGLAIVRRAVERMNGRVWLKSEPGRGTIFFVELPQA